VLFSFSLIFSFLAIFHLLQCALFIFHVSVISWFFKSSIVCFSFSMIFSFLSIFHVLEWRFLIFSHFQFSSPYFMSYSVCFSFSTFSVILPYFRSDSEHSSFFMFLIFLVIFHYLNRIILTFRGLPFSRPIPGPTMCISHFSRFSVISSFFYSSSGCFSFLMIFSFLGIFNDLQWTSLIFQLFQFSSPYFTS